MPNKSLFVITSTINTTIGQFTPEERFCQTIETIQSIKTNWVLSDILLIDNSLKNLPVHQAQQLEFLSNNFLYVGDRYYSKIFNRLGIRGLGQTYMWLIAIDFYNRIKYNYDRIFFISGRYKLRDSFRHEEYSEISMQGKYSLQLLDKEYNTRFFSICPSLINNFTQTLQNILIDFWNDPKNIEPLMYENIDQNLVYNKIILHIEGKLALTTEIVYD